MKCYRDFGCVLIESNRVRFYAIGPQVGFTIHKNTTQNVNFQMEFINF